MMLEPTSTPSLPSLYTAPVVDTYNQAPPKMVRSTSTASKNDPALSSDNEQQHQQQEYIQTLKECTSSVCDSTTAGISVDDDDSLSTAATSGGAGESGFTAGGTRKKKGYLQCCKCHRLVQLRGFARPQRQRGNAAQCRSCVWRGMNRKG